MINSSIWNNLIMCKQMINIKNNYYNEIAILETF